MKRTFREPCGCTYRVQDDREDWTELCKEHAHELSALRAEAAEQHKQTMIEFHRPPAKVTP